MLFSIWAAHSPQGRLNAIVGGAVGVSMIMDIVLLAHFSDDKSIYSNITGKTGFSFAMALIVHLLKYPMMFVFYQLFLEFGGKFGLAFPGATESSESFLPSHRASDSAAATDFVGKQSNSPAPGMPTPSGPSYQGGYQSGAPVGEGHV
eukprot:GABV01009620.1.p1 GENE.GABV01009620.1~~GABV01009620.1.p1  ORF type:complete len:148 (-),score=32.43 GABV01009620.1:38-481(-)